MVHKNLNFIIYVNLIVHLVFNKLATYIKDKINDDEKLLKIKTVAEYLIIALIFYYIFV